MKQGDSAVPVCEEEKSYDGYDGAVGPDDVPGADAHSGFEVIGRAPRGSAGSVVRAGRTAR